jgi:hypothetical protein
MSLISVSPTRRQILAGVIYLTSFAASFGAAAAETAQTWTIKPGSAEERLHESNGRQSDLQIARNRPSQRELAAQVRDERSGWSIQQWDEYARSLRGK